MRRLLQHFLLATGLLMCTNVFAQDIPLFSQKLTNSFVFNPAIAGHTFGSMTYSYKRNYAKVNGAPENHFLSLHTPIANHRFGVGANFYQEDVTFLRNTYASAAFAYHVGFNKFSSLSFGIAGEYNSININGKSNTGIISNDSDFNALADGKLNDYDFSFGVHYQNRFLKAGIAANRMANSWFKGDKAVLSNYYSVFVQGLLPLRGGEDLLEPYIAYRKLSEVNNTLDVGLFYTYNNLITLGVSERSGKVFSGTLAVHISKYLMIGYSREMIIGNVGGFVGAANEITIRYDFNNSTYKERFSSDYKSSMAYRRKTLSSPSRKNGKSSPKQLHRNQKKLAPFSPNSRYQDIKKLSGKSNSSKKKKPSKFKKRKPVKRKH